MMRTNPLGGRSSGNLATLVKIKPLTQEELKEKMQESYNNGNEHFFANRFKLDYFKPGTTDVGLLLFNEALTVNLNVLDLCVFKPNGAAYLRVDNNKFNRDLVSTSWEHRFELLLKYFGKEANMIDGLSPQIDKADKPFRSQLKVKLYPKLCVTQELGKLHCYQSRVFDFGISRVSHLKTSGANYLLERYYKHLSRTAEPHDFASIK